MKKRLSTLLTAGFVVLTTAGFAVAETIATANVNFPYFHFGCLVVGGLIITSLKAKYDKMLVSETIGAFALYALLIIMFTNPVIDAIKNLVG